MYYKFLLIIVLIFMAISVAEAHTYHSSLTRIDYNRSTKNLEISIELYTHDLQPMLENRLKKPVDIGKTPEVDAEILKYLSEKFVFQNAKAESQKMKWVGKEFENDLLIVYLEIPFTEELTGANLTNRIFFEAYSEQTNFVIVHDGDKKYDFLFKSGDSNKQIS